MGLSASQAQLLTLTTRLNNVQGQLSLIADELTQLSGDSSAISSDYTNSMNQEKLVYQDDTSKDVDYSSLMNYSSDMSSYLGNNQYVLTDASSGSVILDDNYLFTCGALSSVKTSGKASDLANDAYAFASKMIYGSESYSTQMAQATSNGTASGSAGDSMKNSGLSYSMAELLADIDNTTMKGNQPSGNWAALYSAGSRIDLYDYGTFDDGKKDETLLKVKSAAGYGRATNSLKGYLSDLGTKTAAVMSINYSSYSTQIAAALNFAYNATYDKFVYNKDTNGTTLASINSTTDYLSGDKLVTAYSVNSDSFSDELGLLDSSKAASSSYRLGKAPADSYNKTSNSIQTLLAVQGLSGDDDSAATDYVNTTELVDTYFGYFNQYLNESNAGWTQDTWTNGYNITGNGTTTHVDGHDNISATKSSQVSKVGIFNDAPSTASTAVQVNGSDVDVSKAEYYIKLYRTIESAGGWKKSDDVDTTDYLQTKIMNGVYTLKKITDTNGNFEAASLGDSTSPICETEDKDKESKATAEYQQKKDEINYKENILDQEQTSLDTEREELENMIQSEKSLVKSDVEMLKIWC